MKDAPACLDIALKLGHEELSHLQEANLDEAERLSLERKDMMDRAFAAPLQEDRAEFLEKLDRLQSLQSKITASARELHATLSQELKKIRSENKRLTGYKKGSTITPMFNAQLRKKG
ncbi:hypothetical protein [Desulfonatronospira sp.]|uniref:hypothetical protein n=1 Tax=Desulfonatronospira sp. TaxID=1962951 RepID=UPI0025BAB92F|nr:hypothetical protein [Desulfonatronospira sp.]